MMRLKEPTSNFDTTLDKCIDGITGNNAFRAKMQGDKPALIQAGTDYVKAGKDGNLYSIAPLNLANNSDPVVIGGLIKSELVNLYEYYFCNEKKTEARKIYEKLLNSAGDDCPFCGGIGRPRNLDHFLPKSRFPQFSVFPNNLVPSCRDCNMDGKAEDFATRAEDQLIQPYVDDDRFFEKQWIYADCTLDTNNRPIAIRYFVSAPDDWNQVHKERVQKHFNDFDLGRRYSVEAARQLKVAVDQILNLQKVGLENQIIRSSILTPGIEKAPFINHWIRGMYQALSNYLEK